MTLSITTLESLKETRDAWRNEGKRVALVPTMGALHAGHMVLVKAAQHMADEVVVSIFVNPTQFGPNEDFTRYPRMLEADLALLEGMGVSAAWVPSVEEMYPQGASATHSAGKLGTILEGEFRPGHFDGVVTVVSRLFAQVKPTIAAFGEKDYQQLCVIERLVKNEGLDVKLLPVPTVREPDGLALSSRNRYLSPAEREIAPMLFATLQGCAAGMMMGEEAADVLALGKQALLRAGFRAVDYLELRAEGTLEPVRNMYETPSRLLVAAHLGTTRLIDNLQVG